MYIYIYIYIYVNIYIYIYIYICMKLPFAFVIGKYILSYLMYHRLRQTDKSSLATHIMLFLSFARIVQSRAS